LNLNCCLYIISTINRGCKTYQLIYVNVLRNNDTALLFWYCFLSYLAFQGTGFLASVLFCLVSRVGCFILCSWYCFLYIDNNSSSNDKKIIVYRILNVGLMVLNATFNNISVISWWSVLLVEETGVTGENHRHAVCH
jgi:hypothetical protein